MQRLIDANKISAYLELEYDGKEVEDFDAEIPVVMTIPDNPTNGDMVKGLFPKCEIMSEDDRFYYIELDSYIPTPIFKNWWNAPYKGGQDADND